MLLCYTCFVPYLIMLHVLDIALLYGQPAKAFLGECPVFLVPTPSSPVLVAGGHRSTDIIGRVPLLLILAAVDRILHHLM